MSKLLLAVAIVASLSPIVYILLGLLGWDGTNYSDFTFTDLLLTALTIGVVWVIPFIIVRLNRV